MSSPLISSEPLLGHPSSAPTEQQQQRGQEPLRVFASPAEKGVSELAVNSNIRTGNATDHAPAHNFPDEDIHHNTSAHVVPIAMDISAERNDDGYNNDDGVTSARRISNGRWKDGTCDWCTLYLCTAFCSVISLAQVMTRMQLNWLGQSTYRASSRGSLTTKYSACRVVTAIVIGYTVLYFLQLSAFLDELDDGNSNKNKKGQSPKSSTTMDVVLVSIMPFVSLTYGVWCLYIHYKTRVTIRGRYQIREECCPGVDDCMCVLCCPFWSVIQMSRHTGDFDRQRASCCSETGLEDMDEFRSGAMMV